MRLCRRVSFAFLLRCANENGPLYFEDSLGCCNDRSFFLSKANGKKSRETAVLPPKSDFQ